MKNQILHIFKNDVRHFWREIVLMAAIVAAYGWHTSTHSQESGFDAMDIGFSFSSQILSLLVSVSFIFLIVRAVHAECPVGDRQFWVTRPYDWRHLLAEKVLFVLAFVNVPLFVLQVFLVWHAGFGPARHISGLLDSQWQWVLRVILPVATLAAVTASTGQFVLAVLGTLVYLFAEQALVMKIPNTGVMNAADIPTAITTYGIYAAAILVVLWQYARRCTIRSRTVLLGVAAAIPILFAVTPYRTVIAHLHPAPAPESPLPVQLAFDPVKPASLKGGYPERNKVHITLPIRVSGIAEGSKVALTGRWVRIEVPGGPSWDSGWEAQNETLLAGRPHTSEIFALERDFFERVKSAPANVHLALALGPARAREVERVVAGPGPFSFPHDGKCSFPPFARGRAVCFFPPQKTDWTERMLLSAKSEEITCNPEENAKPLPAGTIAYGWVWQMGNFGLNPVSASELYVSDSGAPDVPTFRGNVCPGTLLTVYAGWQGGQRYRADLEINGIHLAEYKLDDSVSPEAGGFGVMVPQ
ncbi:MAG: hypothetical protein ABSB82_24435 [Terriglobia bacterium]|jgi:hypothetical protein